jgi:hypothetical protein
LSELSCGREHDGKVIRLPAPKTRAIVADASHPQWDALRNFIAERFERAHGAQITVDYPRIAGLVAGGGDGEILAAAGVRFAETGPLFLEQYLDETIEAEVARVFDGAVSREMIVEIGSLASVHPTWSMQLFDGLPAWLAGVAGRRFAVATLRPELARMLDRSGFGLRPIGEADPKRICGGQTWGDYYAAKPRIYAGRVSGGSALGLMRERLRARVMERQARRGARGSA